MNRLEQIGVIVVILGCALAVCNRYFMPMVLPAVIIVLFVGISNNMLHTSVISARKASTSNKTGSGSASLPQTKNPRHKAVNETESEDTKLPPNAKDKEETGDEGSDEQTDKSTSSLPPRPFAHTNVFSYTLQGMQAKLDERQFRKIDSMQSQDSRARMLETLYQEMLDTSVKGDPAMRLKGDTSDGCSPLRGRTKPFIM